MIKELFPRKQRSKNWMFSSHVDSGLLLELVKRERAFTLSFILPGKVIRAELDKSSSLVENMKSLTSSQIRTYDPALNNNLKFFLLQYHDKQIRRWTVCFRIN